MNVVGMFTPGVLTIAPLLNPVPVTVIVYEPTGIGFGEMEEIAGPGGSTATYTIADVFPSDPNALMVIPFVGILAGAVYRPLSVIVPLAELPPLTPLTDHVTVELGNPVTFAEYCTVPFTPTVV